MIKIIFSAIGLIIGTSLYSQNNEVVSNGGGDINNTTISLDQTIGELVVTDVTGPSTKLEQGFQNTFIKVGLVLNAKVFLQGPYNSSLSLMNDNLRSLGLVPLKSPYVDVATITDPTILDVTGDDAIVDWVFVEIRDRLVAELVVDYKSGLLQKDGDIVDIDGTSLLKFNLMPGTYFVSVNHRNHLGVMSGNALLITKDGDSVLDFTSNAFSTNGNFAQAELITGDMAMWAGDVNNNGQVRYLGPANDTNPIKDNILNPAFGNPTGSNFYAYVGYDNADINMNGQVRYLGPGNDTNFLKDVVLSHPANTTSSNFFPFFVQIPN
ncbi:MAG: hemagglutinin protein [Flavobacteriaceae bacterium]|nr:hemagglutinin protein [Flavobacteriaceae bacterium]